MWWPLTSVLIIVCRESMEPEDLALANGYVCYRRTYTGQSNCDACGFSATVAFIIIYDDVKRINMTNEDVSSIFVTLQRIERYMTTRGYHRCTKHRFYTMITMLSCTVSGEGFNNYKMPNRIDWFSIKILWNENWYLFVQISVLELLCVDLFITEGRIELRSIWQGLSGTFILAAGSETAIISIFTSFPPPGNDPKVISHIYICVKAQQSMRFVNRIVSITLKPFTN